MCSWPALAWKKEMRGVAAIIREEVTEAGNGISLRRPNSGFTCTPSTGAL